jgi:hypothetical protein
VLPFAAAFFWGWLGEDEEFSNTGEFIGQRRAYWRRRIDATLIVTWAYW